MTKHEANQQRSLESFPARRVRFDAPLAELQQASADHFGADPEAVLWGEAAWLAEATLWLVSRDADAPFRGVQMIDSVDFDAQRDILSLHYAGFRSTQNSSTKARTRGQRAFATRATPDAKTTDLLRKLGATELDDPAPYRRFHQKLASRLAARRGIPISWRGTYRNALALDRHSGGTRQESR